MGKKCLECGKEIKEETDSPYCAKCDEKLDRQFEMVEDNILIYKELMPNEIDILNKFEKEDIIDLYIRVFDKFKSEGDFTAEQITVLNNIKTTFGITDSEAGKDRVVEFKEEAKPKTFKKDTCIDCGKKIKEDFNFCPYCGSRLKL
ncbi:MAG: zinc-ribbon domain-containing protein [Actinobacteria bacterium]|nr:zinc-ribbon domain-containing protein [Actinomycetota bacterium]